MRLAHRRRHRDRPALLLRRPITAEPGLDYFIDAGTPIDALARGDWREFFANQPLMGSFSLFLRAPFVAARLPPVGLDGLPRRRRADHRRDARARGLVCCGRMKRAGALGGRARDGRRRADPVTALRPRDSLGPSRGAARRRAVRRRGDRRLAREGVLAGCCSAARSRPSSGRVLAALPAFAAAPGPARAKLVIVSALVALAFTAPMLAGNSDRFFQVQRAAA